MGNIIGPLRCWGAGCWGSGVVSACIAHRTTCGACFFPDRIVCALSPIEPRVFLSMRCNAWTYILIKTRLAFHSIYLLSPLMSSYFPIFCFVSIFGRCTLTISATHLHTSTPLHTRPRLTRPRPPTPSGRIRLELDCRLARTPAAARGRLGWVGARSAGHTRVAID
jgi:hypothetical protein